MLLFGDAFHKFIDGVSVGASFTESIFTGFSVALAIVFEELPHELGNFNTLNFEVHIALGLVVSDSNALTVLCYF